MIKDLSEIMDLCMPYIAEQKFKELYDKLGAMVENFQLSSMVVSQLSYCLLQWDINPLEDMTDCPERFLTKYQAEAPIEITIPNNVKTLGKVSFSSTNAIKKVTISASVAKIYSNNPGAFSYNTNLEEVIFEPNSKLKIIPKTTFGECTNLKTIVLPDNLTTIGDSAFYRDIGLTEIHLPATLRKTGSGIFGACKNLNKIYIDSLEQYLTMDISYRDWFTPNDNVGLYITGTTSPITEIVIPESITLIPSGAFRNYRQATTVKLPKTLLEISSFAFSHCTNLRDVFYDGKVNEFSTYVKRSSLLFPNQIKVIHCTDGDFTL